MEHACFNGGPHVSGLTACWAVEVRGVRHSGAGQVHEFSYACGTEIFFVVVNPQAAGGESLETTLCPAAGSTQEGMCTKKIDFFFRDFGPIYFHL
jgi:hypothetical protein